MFIVHQAKYFRLVLGTVEVLLWSYKKLLHKADSIKVTLIHAVAALIRKNIVKLYHGSSQSTLGSNLIQRNLIYYGIVQGIVVWLICMTYR